MLIRGVLGALLLGLLACTLDACITAEDYLHFSDAGNNTLFGCPNNCSLNGDCNTTTGLCSCYDDYFGDDCSVYATQLHIDEPLGGQQLSPGVTAFYSFAVANATALSITLSGTDPNIPLTLILASSYSVPSPFSYSNIGYGSLYVIQPASALWLFALTAPPDSDVYFFEILASQPLICPNNCSGNGVCLAGGLCDCNYDYDQPDCSSIFREIDSNETIALAVVQGMWASVRVIVGDANQLVFAMNVTSGPDDAAGVSMYARWGYIPTLFDYNAISRTTLPQRELVITGDSVLPGSWYLSVYGASSSAEITITAYVLRRCPADCSQNGVCEAGVCVCQPPFVSVDCSSEDTVIYPEQVLSATVSADQWSYFHVQVLGQDALLVRLQEISRGATNPGATALYLQRGTYPTTSSFAYRNDTLSSLHEIYVPSTAATGLWYIGVLGSARLDLDEGSGFAQFHISTDVGCSAYPDCALCTQDPNCGWCVQSARNSRDGVCTAGSHRGPNAHSCVAFLYLGCNIHKAQRLPTIIGIIVGMSIGAVMLLSLTIAGCLLYSHWQRNLQRAFVPATIARKE